MVRKRAWFLVLLVQMLKPLPQSCMNILERLSSCLYASCEICIDFHLLELQCLHCCNALRGLYSKVGTAGDGYGIMKWHMETKFVLHARRICYFLAFGQNSDSAVGFVDPNFLYRMNILAIDGYLPCDLDL